MDMKQKTRSQWLWIAVIAVLTIVLAVGLFLFPTFPARSLPSRDCSTSSHKFFNNAFLQIVIHSFHRLIPRLRTPYISWVS